MQRILFAIVAILVLAVAVGIALPRKLIIEVNREIDAPPATVFSLLNDFHRVDLWAPLNGNDANARVVFSGPDRGVGATATWDGASVGSGARTITASEPYEFVESTVNPADGGASVSRFRLAPTGSGTTLAWHFETDHGFNLAGRYLALLQKQPLQAEHESALDELQRLAESLPAADFGDIEIEHLAVDAMPIAYLPTTSAPDPGAISAAMGRAYFEILNFVDAQGLHEAGAPLSILRSFSGSELLFDAAIPVRGVTADTPREKGGVRLGETYAGPAIRVRHTGSYRGLGETHRKIVSYLAALGIDRAGPAWEVYVSDPTRVPESELVTYVYYPIEG